MELIIDVACAGAPSFASVGEGWDDYRPGAPYKLLLLVWGSYPIRRWPIQAQLVWEKGAETYPLNPTTGLNGAPGGWPMTQDTFYPFGVEATPPAGPNHYKFSGKERDAASGLDDFGARYYSAVMGRFMSPDDGSDQYPGDPQSWNLYNYVRNNPLSFTDANGHSIIDLGNGCLDQIIEATVSVEGSSSTDFDNQIFCISQSTINGVYSTFDAASKLLNAAGDVNSIV